MTAGEDVAAWVERNLTLETGEPLKLAPFQRTLLDLYRSGRPVRVVCVAPQSARKRDLEQLLALEALLERDASRPA